MEKEKVLGVEEVTSVDEEDGASEEGVSYR